MFSYFIIIRSRNAKGLCLKNLTNQNLGFFFLPVAILLSLYYLFLWNPYIKGMKANPTQKPMPLTVINTTFQLPGDLKLDSPFFKMCSTYSC